MEIQKLTEAGVNYQEGLHRFGDKPDFYEKYLLKFLEDPTYEQLRESLEMGNYEAAFKQAHTLKGIVGNLSLDRLYQKLYPLVELLRANQSDGAEELFAEVTEAYDKVIEAIK